VIYPGDVSDNEIFGIKFFNHGGNSGWRLFCAGGEGICSQCCVMVGYGSGGVYFSGGKIAINFLKHEYTRGRCLKKKGMILYRAF